MYICVCVFWWCDGPSKKSMKITNKNNDIINCSVYCVTLMKRMKTIYVQKIDQLTQTQTESSLKCSIATHKNAKDHALKI